MSTIDKLKEIGAEQFLIECVDIDPIEIDEEFLRQPADLAYWHERYAQAVRRQLDAKHSVPQAEAEMYIDIRDNLIPGEKMTEPNIKAHVATSQKVIDAQAELSKAESEKQRCKGYAEAVASKGNMLQSIGAKLRIEMRDPAVREEQVGRRLSE